MGARLGCSVGGSPTANPQAKPLASKAAKDYVNVGFCGNVAGSVIKSCLLYRAANPSALKGKNKNLLPVFWQSNEKAWVMAGLFLDWFHQCFILEVKQDLPWRERTYFKVLLIIDKAPTIHEALQSAHPNVEVFFLSPSRTSILSIRHHLLFQGHVHRFTF
jgi:hypothetical protein